MRTLLAALLLATAAPAAAQTSPEQAAALPSIKPTAVERYGVDPLQTGELRLPKGKGPFPVAITIHGGCWTKGYATARDFAPVASRLTERGLATWNIEYRQLGDPGAGWPGTFLDWAAAADRLRELAERYPLDLSNVVVVGHSAGALPALWLAARAKLPAGGEVRGENPLPIKASVLIDGPPALERFIGVDAQVCGKPVITPLMGGAPLSVPARYDQGDPGRMLPIGVPQFLVASQVLTPADAERWRAEAAKAGDRVEVIAPEGADHFNIVMPGRPQWEPVEALILKAAGR